MGYKVLFPNNLQFLHKNVKIHQHFKSKPSEEPKISPKKNAGIDGHLPFLLKQSEENSTIFDWLEFEFFSSWIIIRHRGFSRKIIP